MLIKQALVGSITTLSLGAITWMTVTLISVDKRTAVMSVKIEQNNEMLKPLWEDFIKRSARYEQAAIKK
jgi:hypothetical protein|tara:strand:- start:160 stop:366 length:207 start_codon:yes stop_codon:yes gene_type:complete